MIDTIINYSSGIKIKKETLDFISYSTIRQLGIDDYDLSIVCESDDTVQDLNYRYRGLNQTTDVLTFPSGELDPDSGRVYLGDVVISLPTVGKQAAEMGREFTEELAAIVIHGILHLIGYDHADPAESEKMFELQNRILSNMDMNEIRNMDIFRTFRNAFKGFSSAYKTEKNLKVHIFFCFLAILLAIFLNISILEWGILALTISAVFVVEFLNTALEHVVNLASPHYNEVAKNAKDTSAAGVLIAVAASIIIGGLIFLPRLYTFVSALINR